MTSSSPIAALYPILQRVRIQAKAQADIFRKNEAATRAALIEPVLRALGWDTTNVQMVEPEKTLSNELRIDYLLNDPAGRPWVVVEAKCLNMSLDKYGYVGKILGYALSLNVQTVCITDGITWHLHAPLQHGKTEPVVFSLAENDLLPAANELIRWLDAAQCGHGLSPLSAAETAATTPEIPGQPDATSHPDQPVAKSLSKPRELPAATPKFTELTQLDLSALPAGQKPRLLRLPNGQIKPITTWKAVLVEVAQLVLATNPRLPLPFPDQAGKKNALFSLVKPIAGSSIKTVYQGSPVYLYTNYSAAACLANATYAAQQLPPAQRLVSLAVSF